MSLENNRYGIIKDSEKRPLKKVVQEAIYELEKTKKYFKSKTIREVREKLIRALEG